MKQEEKRIISLISMSVALMILATGCVQICYESPRKIKKAAKYTSQIPITVKELKNKVDSDTSQYKILIYYNYCCGACTKRFNDTYYRLWHEMDSSLVSWYFVQSDCSGVKWNEQFLRNYGINTTMYYIRDDSLEYLSYEGNFTNCFFGRHITDESTGTPTTYILAVAVAKTIAQVAVLYNAIAFLVFLIDQRRKLAQRVGNTCYLIGVFAKRCTETVCDTIVGVIAELRTEHDVGHLVGRPLQSELTIPSV